jgi:mono/diheme cytochrome c family protein
LRKVNFRAVISFGFMLAIGLALAIGILASATPEVNAQATGDPARGLQVMQANNCLGCHGGPQLTGNIGPRLAGTSLTYEQFLAKVRSGGGRMPPYPASAVSDEDVRNVHAYARSLSTAPGGQATTAAAGATTAAATTTVARTTTAAGATTAAAGATTAARTTVAGQGGTTGVPATGVGGTTETGSSFNVLWLALPLLVIVGMSGAAIVTRRRSR